MGPVATAGSKPCLVRIVTSGQKGVLFPLLPRARDTTPPLRTGTRTRWTPSVSPTPTPTPTPTRRQASGSSFFFSTRGPSNEEVFFSANVYRSPQIPRPRTHVIVHVI